jgi:hypothetical protein
MVLTPSTGGTVIPLLNVVAPPTTDLIRLLQVPYRSIRLDSEVDFQLQLGILGLLRLSQDLIQDCNLTMRLLDPSVGVFAITSLGAPFASANLFW